MQEKDTIIDCPCPYHYVGVLVLLQGAKVDVATLEVTLTYVRIGTVQSEQNRSTYYQPVIIYSLEEDSASGV